MLKALGSLPLMIVHGCDGLDEITLSDRTMVAELRNGEVQYLLDPASSASTSSTRATSGSPARTQPAPGCSRYWGGEAGPARDIVLLNAGAACTSRKWPTRWSKASTSASPLRPARPAENWDSWWEFQPLNLS